MMSLDDKVINNFEVNIARLVFATFYFNVL